MSIESGKVPSVTPAECHAFLLIKICIVPNSFHQEIKVHAASTKQAVNLCWAML